MRIGELAKSAGVNVQTIRFYERKRLLRAPERSPSGYRAYGDRDLDDVLFIKRSQELGFTLRDIKLLQRLHAKMEGLSDDSRRRTDEFRGIVNIATARLEFVRAKLKSLQHVERQLCDALHILQGVETPICPAARKK